MAKYNQAYWKTTKVTLNTQGRKINHLLHHYDKPFKNYSGCDMTSDCLVLLEWASNNRGRPVSLAVLEEETGIPDDTVRFILHQAQQNRDRSLLFGVAVCYGFHYRIYPEWNRENRWKHRKPIIDATRYSNSPYMDHVDYTDPAMNTHYISEADGEDDGI